MRALGAGTKPPALVGRDSEIESFDIMLERLENGYSSFQYLESWTKSPLGVIDMQF